MTLSVKVGSSETRQLSSLSNYKNRLNELVSPLRQLLRKSAIRWYAYSFFQNIGLLKFVTRAAMAEKPDQYNLKYFGFEHSIHPVSPHSLDPVPPAATDQLSGFHLHQPFVAELHNVRLVGPGAVCVEQTGKVVMESVLPNRDNSTPGFEALPVRMLPALKNPLKPVAEMDTVCSLVNSWGKMFYAHWLCECLTKIEGYEYYKAQTGENPVLMVHSNLNSWQVESLRLLGYAPEDYVQWSGETTRVKKLILPSFRRQSRWSDPDAYHWLRDRMISNLPDVVDPSLTFSPRVFISRSGAKGRRILNEDEVMEVLAPLGFVSYTLETMNFADEVRLFSQAEMIVGTHGSGLVNMIFSTKKPVIIDLYTSWFTGSFMQLTASMGSPYACLECESSSVNMRARWGDMRVDVKKLKRLMNSILLESEATFR